ncbi:MAG TPA: helix-turn-helix domain-containing protein [Nitrososphaerales archaeon]|nr:helix-turn-helix domain-containing protein [Nitrososphaerales archaeon]
MGSGSADVAGFVSGSTLRSSVLELLSTKPVTPTEVAKIENKHVSHICRTLRELEGVGLVEIVSSGSRQKLYRATQSGYELYLSITHKAVR